MAALFMEAQHAAREGLKELEHTVRLLKEWKQRWLIGNSATRPRTTYVWSSLLDHIEIESDVMGRMKKLQQEVEAISSQIEKLKINKRVSECWKEYLEELKQQIKTLMMSESSGEYLASQDMVVKARATEKKVEAVRSIIVRHIQETERLENLDKMRFFLILVHKMLLLLMMTLVLYRGSTLTIILRYHSTNVLIVDLLTYGKQINGFPVSL